MTGCFVKHFKMILIFSSIGLFGHKIFQKQPFRGVLRKRCSGNMQQIYRRTPMPKCNFNNAPKQLYWNCTSAWMFSCKFCCTFSEHLFLRTPLNSYFWYLFFLQARSERNFRFLYQDDARNIKKGNKERQIAGNCKLQYLF